MHKRAYFIMAGITLLIGSLFIQVRQNRILSYGVDSYNAHHILYADKTETERIIKNGPIFKIGAILVNLRKSNTPTDVTVEVINTSTKQTIATQIIPKESIMDDTFSYASFEHQPIAGGHDIEIRFSARDATSKNPTGLRFDPKENIAAIALQERVPVWKFALIVVQNKATNWKLVCIAIIASLFLAASTLLPHTKKMWLIAFGIIVIAAFASRAFVVPHFGGVSGGDAYNYLSISQTISKFQNPFANTKRLPGYPLILTPFYVSGVFNDQEVMRYIQIIASILGIILIAAIARILHLSWPTALTASAILAFQKDYFWTSLRPEPYTLYTALLLASLFFFLKAYTQNKIWIYVAFGLCLGYGAMVRQEGFMFAAVLGICSFIYECYVGRSVKRFAWMYIPALVLVLPFFLHNTISYGHPLYTEYFEGDRLQIVDSFLAFQDSAGATWGIIGSMWKPSWDTLERIRLTNPLFIVSVITLWAWYLLLKYAKRISSGSILSVGIGVAWILAALFAIYFKPQLSGILPVITAGWIFGSVPVFLIETKWKGIVLFIVLLSQLGIATWFHPFPKHYQQSYPIIVLMIATALMSQIPQAKKITTASAIAVSTLPFFIIAVFLLENINAELDRYNENVALDSVTYRAARAARTLPGPIGFDQAYLPARLYFDPDAKYFPDEDNPTPEMEQEWLANNLLKTIIVTNGNNVFKQIPPTWKKIKDFKAAGNGEKIFIGTIYALPL
ncbi:MAG TPA: glycosyltransferase family 39 protein [Candidatus Andersenbacteria bacterium]|nr:glycosyltransferase family 39 protein [Candidatus Andersenbacteria bacterium]